MSRLLKTGGRFVWILMLPCRLSCASCPSWKCFVGCCSVLRTWKGLPPTGYDAEMKRQM
ncbi:hypothetical protein BDV95DRAFT_565988, partial [Massariosphaeria phaeospora]